MSERGVQALRADRDEVLGVAKSLTADEWAAPSDCDGWRVQDVVAHMANVCRAVVDPSALAPGVPGDIEATQSAQVEAHRGWTPDQVLADYEAMSASALEALAGMQQPGTAEMVIPLDNLGSHPLHLLANAFAFDHYCHLRNDILQPNGPVDRPAPPSDDLRLGATIEWLLAGLPQMAPDALRAAVTQPIGLRLTGAGGGEWTILPADGEGLVTVADGIDPATATAIDSPTTEFVVWATRRRPWREREVTHRGDEAYAAQVADAIHVF